MSDEHSSQSREPAPQNRRESDRTGRSGGMDAGGRRKSDHALVRPRSRVTYFAFGASFLFSAGLIGWAFTLPFRSGSLEMQSEPKKLPAEQLAGLEYEARLSADAYVDYTRDLDRRLMEQVQQKNKISEVKHSSSELVEQWKKRVQQRQQQLQTMQQEFGPEPFKKGSLEWQTQQDLQKVLDDAPPGA